MLPRAITSPEHARIQLDGQWVEVLACIPLPATVYTARVNGTPTGTDKLTQITYDTGSGTLGDVVVGQTLFVGSTPGAYDKGQARIRLAPSSTVFYIGTESDINVLDNDYLTVVDEVGLWEKQVRIDSGITYMDYDVVYTNQNDSRLPVVTMGGPVILELIAPTAVAHFDATSSWVPGGGAKTYLWAAPGSSATSSTSASTFDATYNAAGRFRVSCTVTIGGVSRTRYEWVQVFDPAHPPVTQFQVKSITGAKSTGGYTFQMVMYDDSEAGLAAVRDRAQVILWTRDHYGSDGQVSTGYATGRENILCTGWIAGESIVWSPELSSVAFTVEGAHAWLGRITAFPQGLEDVTTTPAQWVDYNTLTMTAFLWSLLVWRSTASQAIDCLVEISTTRIIEMSAAATNLWEQIMVTAGQRLLAPPATDHLSRLFVLIDAQLRSDRSGVVEVMTLAKQDWRMPAQIERAPLSSIGMVDASGFKWDGTTATALFALSPGRVWKRYGRVDSVQALLLDDQAQLNTLAGLIAGQANNEYPQATMQLAGNNRMLDIAPDCYVKLTLAADDTPRGISFTDKRFIPRRISWAWDAASGGLLPTVELEGETFAELAVTGDAPATEPVPPPTPPPTETCPVGYHWDSGLAACVPDGGGTVTPDLVYVFANGKLGRTRNFLSTPHYEDATGSVSGTGTGTAFILDPWGPKQGAYRSFFDVVEHTSDLDTTVPTWTSVLTVGTIQTAMGVSGLEILKLAGSITESGLVYVGWGNPGSGHRCGISVSTDSGATWAHHFVSGSYGSVERIIAHPTNIGEVWYCGENGATSVLYQSTDHGATWTGILGPAFNVVADFDMDYPTGGQTIIGRVGSNHLYYSHTGAAGFGVLVGPTIPSPGGSNRGVFHLNIATQDASDILWLEDITPYHSTDGGVSYSAGAPIYGASQNVVAVGRWPYDKNKVFWLAYPGGGAKIAYSDDLMGTVQDKIGDWVSVMGAAFDNPVMIIPVWVP